MKYTHLGYDFGDKVPGLKLHSGVDLNYGSPYEDKGMDVQCMTDGQVVYSAYAGAGWGNLMVVFHPKYKVWSRYAHLDRRHYSVGIKVKEGDVIGLVGNTGTKYPHLHWDVIREKLPKWTSYTYRFSQANLKKYYVHPIEYVKGIQRAEQEQGQPDEVFLASWQKMIRNGITNGERPKDYLTRQEFALMLDRYDQLAGNHLNK